MSITVVSSEMRLNGDLRGADNLSVAGEIRGSVYIDGRLSVEETGVITGDADVGEVWVAGEIGGDVRATTLIHVTASGRVLGEIVAPRIIVDPGAVLKSSTQLETIREPQEATPVVDVISQPPRRVGPIPEVKRAGFGRVTARPHRRRVIVKNRLRKDK